MSHRRNWNDSANGTSTPRVTTSGTQRVNPDLQNQSVNGVQYDSQGRASEDPNAYYSEILARFNQGDISLEDLYQSLGYGLSGNNMSTEQREDFLKQLIDKMLAKSELDEQRSYDNPLNQLQRLLAAGLSKDSALQALAGGSGSSSSGGSPLIGAAQSPAPSESFANEVSAKTAIANTTFQAISCAAGLASFGVSIPGTLANNTISQISADVTKQAQQALQGVQTGVNALDAALHAGQLSQEDYDKAIQSKNGIIDTLEGIANKYPTSAAANFLQSPDFGVLTSNPYVGRMASEHYKEGRSGRDVARELSYHYDLLEGAKQLQSVDLLKAWQEYDNLRLTYTGLYWDNVAKWFDATYSQKANYDNTLASTEGIRQNTLLSQAQTATEWAKIPFMKAQTDLFNAQVKRTFSDIALDKWRKKVYQGQYTNLMAQSRYTNALAHGQENDNLFSDALINNEYIGHKTALDVITESVFNEYYHNTMKFAAMNSTEYILDYQKYLLQQPKFLATHALFMNLYETDAYNTYRNSKNAPFGSDGYFMRICGGAKMIYNGPYYGNSQNPLMDAGKFGLGVATHLPFK